MLIDNAELLKMFCSLCVRQKRDSPDTAASFTLVSSELQRKDKFMRVLFSCNVRKVQSLFLQDLSCKNSVPTHVCKHINCCCSAPSPFWLFCVHTLLYYGISNERALFPRSTVSTRQKTGLCSSLTATCTRWTPWGSTNPWRASPFTTYDILLFTAFCGRQR